MSLAIALTNSQGKDAGFVLVAGVDEVCRRGSGRWKGQCVFVALPTEPALISDAAYLELADRTEHGEHSLRVANDGTAVSLVAADESGKRFYATIRTDPAIRGLISMMVMRSVFGSKNSSTLNSP